MLGIWRSGWCEHKWFFQVAGLAAASGLIENFPGRLLKNFRRPKANVQLPMIRPGINWKLGVSRQVVWETTMRHQSGTAGIL
jgi:hypothetical protein